MNVKPSDVSTVPHISPFFSPSPAHLSSFPLPFIHIVYRYRNPVRGFDKAVNSPVEPGRLKIFGSFSLQTNTSDKFFKLYKSTRNANMQNIISLADARLQCVRDQVSFSIL